MKHEKRFREDDWDDYAEYGRGKKDKKKGGRRKGDLGVGELFAESAIGDDLMFTADAPKPEKTAKPAEQTPQQRKPFRYNESATIEVKGFRIDLSRVSAVSKTDTVYNGRDSYGIRFDFAGKNGYGRDVWYGTNKKQRDGEYDQYVALWRAAAGGE